MAEWTDTDELEPKVYVCGYCGKEICTKEGYCYEVSGYNEIGNQGKGNIYICHCGRPTYFNEVNEQYPGAKVCEQINNINDDKVENLYNEANNCYSVNAFTSVALCCRKILMNVAVHLGADENKKFAHYVDWLDRENYIPKNSKNWVDQIRKIGNGATHEIDNITKEEAKKTLKCIEMLLRIVYEFPAI